MPSMTYDGHAFQIEGRRVWLVSGSISFAHVPRAQWAHLIHLAKQAGLNGIETPVIWARHEPRQGQFDFTGENDVRHFVELVHAAGLMCVLRPGPYVGQGLDLGGLPAWLLNVPGVRLRTNSQPFLEACSRYINALAAQVRDLQATMPTGGPIVLVQNESNWTCGDEVLAQHYLGELVRYYREAGFNVPIANANDLWQAVEGEIECWRGYDNLLPHLRQLAAVRPNQPRMVIEFRVGEQAIINQPASPAERGDAIVRHLAEVIAAGSQFNIMPFCGGINDGFSGGRLRGSSASLLTASRDCGAPISEAGIPAESISGIRRICTFASHFGRLLANLDPRRHPVMVHPGAAGIEATVSASVVHASGPQGGVVFIFAGTPHAQEARRGANAHDTDEAIPLLLPDGSMLRVSLGKPAAGGLPVVWCLLNARLTGRAELDYCNLCAMAMVGRVFVCFGPPGADGVLSINGSRMEVVVPVGDGAPIVQEHEGITIVVANPDQLARIAWTDQNVYVGVAGVDREGRVIPLADQKNYLRLGADGSITTVRASAVVAHKGAAHIRPVKIHTEEWEAASVAEYVNGTSSRFATIPGPADLVALGSPYVYGWYRLRLSGSGSGKSDICAPQSGHRLHLWLDGKNAGLIGIGPGADADASLALKKKPQLLVVLAENAGRYSGGAEFGEKTGLYGHLWEVEANKPGKPKLVDADPVDLLALRAPLWEVHRGDTSDPRRLQWIVSHRGKSSLVMRIADLPDPSPSGVVILNGKPVHFFQQGGGAPIMFTPEQLVGGKNTIEISIVGSTEAHAAALAKAVQFLDATECITQKCEWAFAKWEPPAADQYAPIRGRGASGGMPMWFRTTFTPDAGDQPVYFDAAGLSKGQIYLNGKHLCRYFVATPDGKRVPPQSKFLLPRAMLKPGEPNELVIFDEHGRAPGKTRILADIHESSIDVSEAKPARK